MGDAHGGCPWGMPMEDAPGGCPWGDGLQDSLGSRHDGAGLRLLCACAPVERVHGVLGRTRWAVEAGGAGRSRRWAGGGTIVWPGRASRLPTLRPAAACPHPHPHPTPISEPVLIRAGLSLEACPRWRQGVPKCDTGEARPPRQCGAPLTRCTAPAVLAWHALSPLPQRPGRALLTFRPWRGSRRSGTR